MDDLIKYTEDKNFVRWVLKPNEQLDSFWKEYLKNNPGETEQIESARTVILCFQIKKEKIEASETEQLFQGIMNGVEEKKKKQSVRNLSISILRYAAVVIFFIMAGLGYYYFQKPADFEQNAQQLMAQAIVNSGDSQLILYNGEKITLNERISYIEHINDGKIVIGSKDTIFIEDSNNTQLNQLIVPEGRNSKIKLSDGTVIHINASSQLVFPSVFNKNKRQVYLIGEGFFEVKNKSDIPFVAFTNNLEIEVLGTKFNLSSYPLENSIETFLFEGKVKVKETKFTDNEQFLNPMQKAVFNKNGNEILVSNVEDEEYITWYKGYLSFKSKDLASIVKKLERQYNVEIEFNTPELESRTISGKLKLHQEEFETVIQVLANTASISVEKLSDSTYILK